MKPVNHALLAQQPQAEQNAKGRFYNPTRLQLVPQKELFKWLLRRRGQLPKPICFPHAKEGAEGIYGPTPDQPLLTWIGHSTFLLRYRDTAVLTDPVFSRWVSPVQGVGPKRSTPPALQIHELPTITAVVISHNHYDHLDKNSVLALFKRFGDTLQWFVPLGVKAWFVKQGIHNVVELDWWQSAEIQGLRCYFLPAQHFSGRTLSDAYSTLWGSWMIDMPSFRCYFAGDTGYYAPLFNTIGKGFPAIDLALLPIGAYHPRELMRNMHINPEEAVDIHQQLGAALSVGMHWGSFQLTDEPMDEPPERLAAALAQQGVNQQDFIVMEHGEVLEIKLDQVAPNEQ